MATYALDLERCTIEVLRIVMSVTSLALPSRENPGTKKEGETAWACTSLTTRVSGRTGGEDFSALQ